MVLDLDVLKETATHRPFPGWAAARAARPRRESVELARQIAALIHQHPTCGYRRLWAELRIRQGHRSTHKTVYRVR